MNKQVKSFNAFVLEYYQPKVFTEAKSELWASTPLTDKKQEILTPAQQLQLRKNIAAASTKDEIMKLLMVLFLATLNRVKLHLLIWNPPLMIGTVCIPNQVTRL